MTSTPTRKEDVQDPIGITGWPLEKGRDGERTPMQWDAGRNGGFTTSAKPWLPVPPIAGTVNVVSEEKDPASLLNWYKKLIAMRRTNPRTARWLVQDAGCGQHDCPLLPAEGVGGSPAVLVMMNISADPQKAVVDAAANGEDASYADHG